MTEIAVAAGLRSDSDAAALLNAAITDTATSLTVETGHGASFPASGFHVAVGGEIIAVATRSTDTFSGLARGAEGTTAVPHNKRDELREFTPASLVGVLVAQVVPLTTPTVQDVIDALVALGLVTQSD